MRIHERSRRRATLAALLVLPLFLVSFAAKCGPDKTNNNQGVNQNNTQPVGITDEVDVKLGVEIRKAISRNDRNVAGVSALDLHVFSVSGKVGITGTVANDAARAEVIRIARETEVEVGGRKFKALGVDDGQFTVKPPTPSPTPASSPSASPSPTP